MSMTDNTLNIIRRDGVTLYRNTVVGVVDETGEIITVGSMVTQLGGRITQEKADSDRMAERVAELSDALQVLVDEVLELQHGKPNRKALEMAVENAVAVRSGKACNKPE